MPIDQVKPLDVQEWLDGLAYGNAYNSMIVMRRTLDFAVNLEQIPSNPFRREYEMPRKTPRRSKDVYTLEQAEAMLARIEGMPYEAAYILAAFGGCRTGESLGVRVEDVREIQAGGVRFAAASIDKQVGNLNGEIAWRTKNGQSVREAIVPEPYCDALFRVRDQRAADGFEWLCMMGAKPMGKIAARRMWRRFGVIPFANLRNSWRTFAQFEWGRRICHARTAHGAQAAGRDGEPLSAPVDRAARRGLRSRVCRKKRPLGINWDMKTRNPRSDWYVLIFA